MEPADWTEENTWNRMGGFWHPPNPNWPTSPVGGQGSLFGYDSNSAVTLGAAVGEAGRLFNRQTGDATKGSAHSYYATDIGDLDPSEHILTMTGTAFQREGGGNAAIGWFDKDAEFVCDYGCTYGQANNLHIFGLFFDVNDVFAYSGPIVGDRKVTGMAPIATIHNPFVFELEFNPFGGRKGDLHGETRNPERSPHNNFRVYT